MNLSLFLSKLILHKRSFIQLSFLKLYEKLNKYIFKRTFRPEYEILLDHYLSKTENKNLDHISIIEFGVASGKSLKYLENIKSKFEKKYKLKIKIFGFDTFEGMPKSRNKYDQLYDWKEGDYYSSYNDVNSSLKYTKLIKGDVKNSINLKIFKDYGISNVLIIFFDLDFFTSTNYSFKIFEKSFSKTLRPRVGLFFDNLHSSSEFSGEYLSIKKFNEKNLRNNKFISKDFYLEKFDNRFYQYMNFEHKLFNENLKKNQYL